MTGKSILFLARQGSRTIQRLLLPAVEPSMLGHQKVAGWSLAHPPSRSPGVEASQPFQGDVAPSNTKDE